jgi:hypothetical protein
MKDAENWEEQGELDYDRQLELERRRQDLQRQLALMDEEDAAASTEETSWKGIEKEEEQRKVPIVHSRLHPEPSATPPDDGAVPQQTITKKKKKKKLDSEGEGTKIKKKKEASPRKKDETKRKVTAKVDEDVSVKKEVAMDVERVKKGSAGYVGSSDDTDLSEHYQTEREVRKTSRSSAGGGKNRNVPEPRPEGSLAKAPVEEPRKRQVEDEYRRKREGFSPQPKSSREKRKSESTASSDEPIPRQVDEGRPRKSRDHPEYYPSPDEHEEGNQKIHSKVVGHPRRPLSN